MNKRRIHIFAALIALLIFCSCTAFAGDPFRLKETQPAAGSKDSTLQNVAVKLIFTAPISAEETRKANDGIFSIVAADGTGMEYTALYDSEKYPNEVWLQCASDLQNATQYTVTIPASMKADDGSVLGSSVAVSFSTRDVKKDNRVYMIFMLLMFAAMMLFTIRDAKKQADGNNGKKKSKNSEKVNPYKESKKTGQSVSEINQKSDARKKKAAEKAAKLEAEKEAIRQEIRAERIAARKAAQKHCKVKKSGKRSYVSTGRTYPKAYIAGLHQQQTK